VTLAIVLGILGVPIVDACAGDSRGLIACLRDMAERRFNLPGEAPRTATTPAMDAPAEPVAAVPAAPMIVAEADEGLPVAEDTPPLPLRRPPGYAAPTAPAVTEAGPASPPAGQPQSASEEQPSVDVAPLMPPSLALEPTPAPAVADSPSAVPPVAVEEPGQTPAAVGSADLVEPLVHPSEPATSAPSAGRVANLPSMEPAEQNTQDRAAGSPLEPAGQGGPLVPPVADSPELPPVSTEPPAEPTAAAAPPPTAEPPGPVPEPPMEPAPALPSERYQRVPVIVPPPPATLAAPQPELETAYSEPVQPRPAPQVAAPVALAPTIDAIELEGDASYISGSGPPGALMRLYADGELVGESAVEEGRWLVETGALLTTPRRELRVEAIELETGRSLGNAVITVEIVPPETPVPEQQPGERSETIAPATVSPGPPAETAPATPGEVDAPRSVPVLPGPEAISPASEPVSEQPAAEAPMADIEGQGAWVGPAPSPQPEPPPALPASGPTPSTTAGAMETAGAAMLPPGPDTPTPGAASAAGAPEPRFPELVATTPVGESNSVTILPSTAAADSASIVTLGEPTAPALLVEFDTPRPAGQPMSVILLVPFGDPVSGRFTGGKAIIRRGDTLWSIAHRYYGSGIHYRTIFNANRDQIHRPSRIFPGQVFDLPLVTDDRL